MTHKKIQTLHVSLSVEDALHDIYKEWAEYSCVGEVAGWLIIYSCTEFIRAVNNRCWWSIIANLGRLGLMRTALT